MAISVKEAARILKMMGTTIELKIGHTDPEHLLDELESKLIMYEQRFSTNDSTSELNQINQAAGINNVVVHPDLYELIQIGKNYSCRPNSNLNIAIGPLVQAWQIGFSDAKVLAWSQVARLLSLTNPHNILIQYNHAIMLAATGMKIDLGALAKGYIADKLWQHCLARGAQYGLINLGGNLVCFGDAPNHNDGYWRIGIRDPAGGRSESLTTILVKNKSIVTSGIYERVYKSGGKTYHHILDPRTGFPIECDYMSITIVADTSLDGEIWTSTLFGKPVPEVLSTIEQNPVIEGIVAGNDRKILVSANIKKNMNE